MDFEEQNDLLQDYRYRKHILEEISLAKIKEWNNADWNNIINKPTTLDGYGITDSLKVVDGVVKNTDELKWIDSLGGISSSYCNGQNNSYVGLDNGSLNIATNIYDTTKQNYVSFNSISLRKGIMLTSYDGVVLTTNTKLYIGENSERDIDIANRLEVIQKSNNNLLFGNTRIPNKMNNVLNIPRIDILNNSDVVEGGLWNSTYNINGTIKDGLHLTHQKGKYLALGYENPDTGVYNSYMIMDDEGVLKNSSDGVDWSPIRFEQEAFFRHGIRIGSGTDIYFHGNTGGVDSRLSSIEYALANGTYTDKDGHIVTSYVDWTNVKNKPTTLSGYGNTINGKLNFVGVDGYGLNFWESEMYSIYMSSANNTTYGGRLWETTSDYNMYFKMTEGTNRGFVFKNGNTVLGGLDGNGILRAMNAVLTKNIYFGGTDTTATGSIENGNITLNKTKIIYGTNTNGEKKNLMQLDAANVLCVGNNGGGTTLIVPNASVDALVLDCSDVKNYKIWNEKNFNPNNYNKELLSVEFKNYDITPNGGNNGYYDMEVNTKLDGEISMNGAKFIIPQTGLYKISGLFGFTASTNGYIQLFAQRFCGDTSIESRILIRINLNAGQVDIRGFNVPMQCNTGDQLLFFSGENTASGSTHNNLLIIEKIK